MRKVYFVLAIVLVAMILIGGCAAPAPAPAPLSLPKEVKLGTHEVGSFFNVAGTAVASLSTKYTPMTVKVVALAGPPAWLPMMETLEIDMGILNAYDAKAAWTGTKAYQEPTGGKGFEIRLLEIGSPTQLGIIVPKDSAIMKISEIKGKRFPSEFGGHPLINDMYAAFLANGGLTYDDVIGVPRVGPGAGKVESLVERKVDADLMTLGDPAAFELEPTVGIRYLDLDTSPEAMARTHEYFPYNPVTVQPGPANPGVVHPDTVIFSYDVYIVARADLSDDVAYEIVKATYSYYVELGDVHDKLKMWTADGMATATSTVPYHPGAIRWYQEAGVWTSEMEAHQKELLAMK